MADDLYTALRNADAAGDVEGAKKLADYIKTQGTSYPGANANLSNKMDAMDKAGGKVDIQIGPDGKVIDNSIAKQAAESPKAEPAKSAPTIGDFNPQIGLAEAGMSLLSGMVAAPVAGLAGLGTLAGKSLGLTNADPAEVVQKVQGALTTEPKSQIGKTATSIASAPFEALAYGADKAGSKVRDLTDSPVAATAVNTAIQAIPMILGKVAPKVYAKLQALDTEAAAKRASVAALEEPVKSGIQGAHEMGYVLTPEKAGAGAINQSVESLAGSAKMQRAASQKNAAVTNDLIRKDIGLPEDQPITRETLSQVRKEASTAYDAIKNVGEIKNDPQYFQDLSKVSSSYDTASKSYPHRSENPFQKTLDGLSQPIVDSAAAIEEVKLLRSDADKAFQTGDKGLATAYRGLAQAVDDSLDRSLKTVSPDLENAVADYRQARKTIAKSYLAEKALNETTGNIDASVYANALKNKTPLDGGALQVGKFARQFPQLSRPAEKLASSTGPTIGDLLAAGISKEWLLAGARPAARSIVLSKPYQNLMTKPKVEGRGFLGAATDLSKLQSNSPLTIAELAAQASQGNK